MIYILELKRIKSVYYAFYEAPNEVRACEEVQGILDALQGMVPQIQRVLLVSVTAANKRDVVLDSNPYFLDVYFNPTTGNNILCAGSNFVEDLYFTQYGNSETITGAVKGVGDFGKYTVSVNGKTYFNGDAWAKILFTVMRVGVMDAAAANVEWATQSLQIATDLLWECTSDFTPKEAGGVMRMPTQMKWAVVLPNEPTPCRLQLSVSHFAYNGQNFNGYTTKDKTYNYLLLVNPAYFDI